MKTLLVLTLLCIFGMQQIKAQTKEAEFKKTEAILKRSNGLVLPDMKIVDYVFSEKGIKMEVMKDGKNLAAAAKPDWSTFGYTISASDTNDKISIVVFSSDEEFNITHYQNSKQVDQYRDDEVRFLFNSSDADLLDAQLEILRNYTLKGFNEVTVADKESLIRFINKHLSSAIKEDKGKVKAISACEITIAYGDEEFTVPTKNIELHTVKNGNPWSSSFGQFSTSLEAPYVFCYGKKGASVKTKNGTTTSTETVEHPEIDLYLPEDSVSPLRYAIQRLASFCKL